MPALASTPESLTVSELTRRIRQTLESGIGKVWVEGEISNLRHQNSGHKYFSLKDADAQIRCVIFRGQDKDQTPIRDGMKVRVHGDLSVYETKGEYQIIVRIVQQKGVGELQARYEALKRRLDAEGLFRPDRKRAIPRFPRTIALVTSPTGAAVQDMLHVLSRRAPWVRLIIAPVRVQGEGAHEEIAAMIRRLGERAIPGLPEIDTLIVARGGGSIEDLWNFNEESVARAVAGCPIPVISGVGHEIDFTICDFAADLRAPTPSAAAEIAVPDQAELLNDLNRARTRMESSVRTRMEQSRRLLELVSRSAIFQEPGRVLAERRQRLDDSAERMEAALETRLRRVRDRVDHATRLLEMSRPDRLLAQRSEWLQMLGERLAQAVRRRLEEQRQRLAPLANLVRTLGPESVLSRGYSLTVDAGGNVISSVAEASPGSRLVTRLRDGELESEVKEVRPGHGGRE
ncbi:MAG: exodeoxyribonuclease VII large subunit [Verrucomicrobia bacterium]|nr:exodeoxyribonuclease VII large subunit [Verrucomicrobiota bacterium]